MSIRGSVGLLALLVACGAPEAPKTPKNTPATAPEPPLVAQKAAGPELPPEDPSLGDQYLVILASKTDPAEVTPALEAARAKPELGGRARTLLSSRFKNLMPCYTVAIADASPDKAAAFKLSKALTAAGIDNYVKNAGRYVGPSPAIDAFCQGFVSGRTATSSARLVQVVSGKGWVPLGAQVPGELPDPERMDDTYGAWKQPIAAGALTDAGPDAWRLVAMDTGVSQVCRREAVAALTLGTPHFGVLQGEEKPVEPTCGEPAVYAGLDCALEIGPWLAVPESAPAPLPYKRVQGENNSLLESARAALDRLDAWKTYTAVDPNVPIERTVSVSRFEGPGGAFHVVEGAITEGEGPCGGDEVAFRALYAAEGEGLGRRLGPFQEAHFSTLLGLVDVEGDGAPEVLWTEFPDVSRLGRADGTVVTEHTVAFCDCAC